jgi:chorismate dehydratase
MRIGAVNYLNSKPLVHGLEAIPRASVLYDLPSRLADSLAAGRLDVALIPSIEWLRQSCYEIVSDACVACRGPVLSVKLYFRVPPQAVRRVALDEGSRTSAALALILLDELVDVRPECEPLAIGDGPESSEADAVLLIGDRAIQNADALALECWDLGECWNHWTGLPFVFAMWVARPNIDTSELARALAAARDRGVADVVRIAKRESAALGIREELAIRYLRENLHFALGEAELGGLRRFAALCAERGLVPHDAAGLFEHLYLDGCTKS